MTLIESKEVAAKLGVCYDTFRKKVKHQPDFPKPVLLTPNAHPKWPVDAIENYLRKKAA